VIPRAFLFSFDQYHIVMERIKREQNDNVQGYNTNKKRKLQDENNHPNK
jgi:hypothetical protein